MTEQEQLIEKVKQLKKEIDDKRMDEYISAAVDRYMTNLYKKYFKQEASECENMNR